MKKRLALLLIIPVLLAAGVLLYVALSGTYITQYADQTGSQAMFYTIETGKGHLIVVDGGTSGNAGYVREVIEEKGGKIDAWIITHPHPDHVGAFNELWEEYKDRIETVYAPEIDYIAYQNKAQEWDGFEYYTRFLEYMADCDKLTYLHEGDAFRIGDLQFNVIYAYCEAVNVLSRDIPNDGSLVFKVSGKTESMLFCSDVGIAMSDTILQKHSEELKCDYIQMAHHGNGGLQESLYRVTEPKAAFFDAPEWLMNPGEGKNYTTPANRALMEGMGAEIFYYATAPNRIELK